MKRASILHIPLIAVLAVLLMFAAQVSPGAAAAKPEQGFVPLFNDTDLGGWHVAGQPSWSAQDGAIVCSGQGGGYLWTDAEYEDFVLRLEYQISPGGNSGVFCRASLDEPVDRGWEVQVLDDYGQEPTTGTAGAIYGIVSPYRNASRKAGEWNKAEITCDQGRIVVVMNGVKIVDVESDQIPRLAARPRRGHIGLQNHHTLVKYRNIQIKPLSFDLFNGKDLAGWHVVGEPASAWTAIDRVLTCSGQGRGWIRSDKQYRDFLLRLEYSISKGGNSGIFIRATEEGDPAFTGMEIQVLDDYGKKPDIHSAGSIYGAVGPCRNMSKPPDEWNSVAIMCQGSHLTITMNGIKTIDVDLNDPALNALDIQERKLKDRVRVGYVGMQNHGSVVRYRNIRINPL